MRTKMDRPFVRHLARTLNRLDMARWTRDRHHLQEVQVLFAELSRVPLHLPSVLESPQLLPAVPVEDAPILGIVQTGWVRFSIFQWNRTELNNPPDVVGMFI